MLYQKMEYATTKSEDTLKQRMIPFKSKILRNEKITLGTKKIKLNYITVNTAQNPQMRECILRILFKFNIKYLRNFKLFWMYLDTFYELVLPGQAFGFYHSGLSCPKRFFHPFHSKEKTEKVRNGESMVRMFLSMSASPWCDRC